MFYLIACNDAILCRGYFKDVLCLWSVVFKWGNTAYRVSPLWIFTTFIKVHAYIPDIRLRREGLCCTLLRLVEEKVYSYTTTGAWPKPLVQKEILHYMGRWAQAYVPSWMEQPWGTPWAESRHTLGQRTPFGHFGKGQSPYHEARCSSAPGNNQSNVRHSGGPILTNFEPNFFDQASNFVFHCQR